MKLIARTAIGLWLLVAGYFFWSGITSKPSENDSLMWHIPVAQSLVEGKIWGNNLYQSPFGYYPAMGEAVLAILMILRIPLNLFNWLGWLALFIVMRALGIRKGIGRELATVLAVGLVFLPTVMRLFPTQLIDVWLAIWWGWLLWLLEKPSRKTGYWVSLGVASGLVVGTKYTGLVLVFLAAVAYRKNIMKVWNLRGAAVFGLLFLIIGAFWYIRNWAVFGDPLYPQNFLWFKGYSFYQLPIVWKDLLFSARGIGIFITAWFSEYLMWGLLILLPLVVRNTWVGMGLIISGMYLFLPGDARTAVSNLRYLVPGFMVLIISLGEYLEKKKKEEWLSTVVLVNAAAVLPQLDYHPKVWLLGMVIWAGVLWRFIYDKNAK